MTRRLLNLARESRLVLAWTVIFGFLTGLLTIGQAAGLSRIINGCFLGGETLPDMVGLFRLLLLIAFLRALLAWGSEISAHAAAVQIKNDLRKRLFEKILSLGPAYTRGERTGELVNTVVEGVEALDAYFSQYLPQLVIAGLVPLSILIIVFPSDPFSGLVLFLTAPLIPVFMYLIGKAAEKLTKRQWDTLGRLSAHFLDSLQGLTTLKELGRSRKYANSISEASERFRDVTLSVLRVTFLSALVLELVATVSTALVAVEVSLRLLYGQLAFQQALFLLLLAPEFYLPLRMLGLRFHAGMSGTTAARRIYEILDSHVEEAEHGVKNEDTSQLGSVAPPLFSTLFLSDLSYTYPGETEPALKDIALEIHAGEHFALVGMSGAGKSTLISLLMQFIQPDRGQIATEHGPIKDYSLESWRSGIAWVPQNPYLFHDTMSANLRMARPDATMEQIVAVTRAAHLDEFIQSLPDGYETVIGDEGIRLSAGQAQRLALARAFLKDAPILILDEPTSSLDPEQERIITSAIDDLMRGRTVLTIAHRQNTVSQADRIYVLEKGSLVEEGTHRELLARGGFYASLLNVPVGGKGQKGNPHSDSPSLKVDIIPPAIPPPSITNRQFSTFVRLLGFLRGSWGWVALSVLLGALTVGSNVGLMGTSAYLISVAALHPELGALQVAISGVRFFGIARGGFRYAERLTTHNVTFRLLARLRTWFYQALEPLAPARLMQYHSGDLLARILADVEILENFYVRAIAPSLVATVIAAGMVFFFSRYDLTLALVYLVFQIGLGVGIPLLAWFLSRRVGMELVSQRGKLQTHLVDGIQGLAELLAFGRGADFSKGLFAEGKVYGQIQRRLASLTGFSNALVILLVNLGIMTVLALTVGLAAVVKIPGIMLAVLTLSALAGFEAVMPLSITAQTLSSSLQAARRLFEIVDEEPVVRDPLIANQPSLLQTYIAKNESRYPNYELQLSHLTFFYPKSKVPALYDVSFQLPPGKRIAILGPSGAGKSTLKNLILRFWDYSQGHILLNNRDLHEFLQEEVRELINIISQRTYFFNDSIRQNLLLARPAASEAEVVNAAQRAQIHDFIVGLPKGYETIIGERGYRLSGGERQRLAIARALLKNAPIFLLDEPTANLDAVNEKHILDELFKLTIGQSLLLITHRLVGLENMDEILVLDRGCMVERGSHAGLLTAGGFYRRMWDMQNRILEEKSLDKTEQ
jgi:ATP-binding cassette subfamily C protein CydCD